MLRQLSLVWVLTACFATAATAAQPLIWIEAEQAVKKQLMDNAGLNDVNPDELSGGKWICSFSHEKEPLSGLNHGFSQRKPPRLSRSDSVNMPRPS